MKIKMWRNIPPKGTIPYRWKVWRPNHKVTCIWVGPLYILVRK